MKKTSERRGGEKQNDRDLEIKNTGFCGTEEAGWMKKQREPNRRFFGDLRNEKEGRREEEGKKSEGDENSMSPYNV